MEKSSALIEWCLTFLVMAVVGAVWCVEARAPLAERIRALEPIVTWTAVKRPDGQAPLFFLSLHQPARSVLSLIHVPEETQLDGGETLASTYRRAERISGDGRKAAQAASERAHAAIFALPLLNRQDLGPPRFAYEEPEAFPEGSPPVAMKQWLLRAYTGLAFWKNIPAIIRRHIRTSGPPAPDRADFQSRAAAVLDGLAHALELRRMPFTAVHPALLPEGPSLESYLQRELFPPARIGAPDGPISAEVLNASGRRGIALGATKVLRLEGVDVRFFGNARSDHPGTIVYDRTGRIENAFRVCRALGCPTAQAVTSIKDQTLVDVTVVLHEDCGRMVREIPENQD